MKVLKQDFGDQFLRHGDSWRSHFHGTRCYGCGERMDECCDWESGATFQIVSEANRNNLVEIKNGFHALREEFNVGGVRKLLSSAARKVKCVNIVVLDQNQSCVVNKAPGECIVKVKDET